MSSNENEPKPKRNGVIICYTMCWACNFDPPEPHTWMDADDLDCADPELRVLSVAELTERRSCGCPCARPAAEASA